MQIVMAGTVLGGACADAYQHRLSQTAEIILFERGPKASIVRSSKSTVRIQKNRKYTKLDVNQNRRPH